MRLPKWCLAAVPVAAIAALAIVQSPAGAAPVAPASAMAPNYMAVHTQVTPATCDDIKNFGASRYIAGNGVNEPVILVQQADANCFTIEYSGTSSYGNWNEWQNGDGHCLFNNGGTLDVGGACAGSGHPNEEMISPGVSGGNEFAAVAIQPSGWWVASPCGENGNVFAGDNSAGNCYIWNF